MGVAIHAIHVGGTYKAYFGGFLYDVLAINRDKETSVIYKVIDGSKKNDGYVGKICQASRDNFAGRVLREV